MIPASLSVRTTSGHFRAGGRDLGVLDASRESLALLFVLVVLVSEAEETVGHLYTKVHAVHVVFPGPGNIYILNLARIAFWSMQARHRPYKAAVAHSEVLVTVFVRICRYDIVAVKLQWPLL